MNGELKKYHEKLSSLFGNDNLTGENIEELFQLKGKILAEYKKDKSSLETPACIEPLAELRIRMNLFFFATNPERDEVDGLLFEAFRNNAGLVTKQAVTARLEKVYKENDLDWGGHLAIASAMVAAKPDALEEVVLGSLVEWSRSDGEREKSFHRTNFVEIFTKSCGCSHTP